MKKLIRNSTPPPFQATLCALIQEKEFSTVVATTELQKTTGTVRFKTLTMNSLFERCSIFIFSYLMLHVFPLLFLIFCFDTSVHSIIWRIVICTNEDTFIQFRTQHFFWGSWVSVYPYGHQWIWLTAIKFGILYVKIF